MFSLDKLSLIRDQVLITLVHTTFSEWIDLCSKYRCINVMLKKSLRNPLKVPHGKRLFPTRPGASHKD